MTTICLLTLRPCFGPVQYPKAISYFFIYKKNKSSIFEIIRARDVKLLVAMPCANCFAPGDTLRCSRCKSAFYCSRECQSAHWKGGHKAKCNQQQKGREEEAVRLIEGVVGMTLYRGELGI